MRHTEANPAPAQSTKPDDPLRHRPEQPGSSAVLGPNWVIKGNVHSEADLTIDGEVEGTIDVPGHRLTIGPSGKVAVDTMTANEVVVSGSVRGNIEASGRVTIRKDAKLVGDVQTAGVVIEDGAYFKGGIHIRRAT